MSPLRLAYVEEGVIFDGGIQAQLLRAFANIRIFISYRELQREKAWSRIHLVPLLMAESDRDVYRRDCAALEREKVIMKDVPGWEVSPFFVLLIPRVPMRQYLTA